jgi:prepilin-type N-terminal cleavage/methylation domain-containing protein/prepilin-type processing-associated H-X9-DG protein
MRRRLRPAFTLVELLTVIAIIAVVLGLLLAAVQRARDAAARAQCANNLRQIGLAAHQHHDLHGQLPPGVTGDAGDFPRVSWLSRLLPLVEQQSLWAEIVTDYALLADPFRSPPHAPMATVVRVWDCPSDPRVSAPQTSHGRRVALTSYVGVNGTNLYKQDGLLYLDSQVRFGDVTDGLSNTLLAGERPPSADMNYGWWYAGVGQDRTGSADMLLGTNELNLGGHYLWQCAPGPYAFAPGRFDNQCDCLHFWSPHPGGGHFLFADGSTHFLSYSAASVLTALGTRAGGETLDGGSY